MHPESRFKNAIFTNACIIKRRLIRRNRHTHIVKEANCWEEQWHLGFDPTAQIIYGMAPRDFSNLAKSIIREARQFSRRALAIASRLSLSQVSRILCGRVKPTKKALIKLAGGIEILRNRRREFGPSNVAGPQMRPSVGW
jgi:hypothetical protein